MNLDKSANIYSSKRLSHLPAIIKFARTAINLTTHTTGGPIKSSGKLEHKVDPIQIE